MQRERGKNRSQSKYIQYARAKRFFFFYNGIPGISAPGYRGSLATESLTRYVGIRVAFLSHFCNINFFCSNEIFNINGKRIKVKKISRFSITVIHRFNPMLDSECHILCKYVFSKYCSHNSKFTKYFYKNTKFLEKNFYYSEYTINKYFDIHALYPISNHLI